MSIELYEQLVEQSLTDLAVAEAEAEYKTDNKLLDARQTLASLKRKHFE